MAIGYRAGIALADEATKNMPRGPDVFEALQADSVGFQWFCSAFGLSFPLSMLAASLVYRILRRFQIKPGK